MSMAREAQKGKRSGPTDRVARSVGELMKQGSPKDHAVTGYEDVAQRMNQKKLGGGGGDFPASPAKRMRQGGFGKGG